MPDRSYHFIPGTRPELFDRVGQLGADHYVLDLEDAVPEKLKNAARMAVVEFIHSRPRASCFVRINPLDTAAGAADVAALAGVRDLGVMASKLENEAGVQALEVALGAEPWRLFGLIESYAAMERLPSILEKAGSRMVAMALGMEDLLTSTWFTEVDLHDLTTHIRCRFTMACRARGVTPIDGICLDTSDVGRIRAHAVRGRSAGLAGQLTIHPAQIPFVNDIYGVPQEQARWADHVLQVAGNEATTGYVRHGDLLVTPPKVRKARYIKGSLGKDDA